VQLTGKVRPCFSICAMGPLFSNVAPSAPDRRLATKLVPASLSALVVLAGIFSRFADLVLGSHGQRAMVGRRRQLEIERSNALTYGSCMLGPHQHGILKLTIN
jgi:hypothetical protein